MPSLAEPLGSADTTAQLSARFAYAAAMKSINNLLLLGDGETWARQRIDFAGLPEMMRTFLQVAAGAADIPVTRLLGQSPAGLSATGDSDTRHYYDMIAARQELDLRPQLERLDRLILRSEGIDPASLTFAFRPLWQMDAPSQAALALVKAQATQIYAGLGLWPTEVTARLVEAQLVADGTYPNAAAVFAEGEPGGVENSSPTLDFNWAQPRDPDGRWTEGSGGTAVPPHASAKTPNTGSLTPPAPATSVAAFPNHEPSTRGQAPQAPDRMPVMLAAFSIAGGSVPHAPDNTPIVLAASRGGRRRGWLPAIGTLLGGVERFLRERLPEGEEPDEPGLPPEQDPEPSPAQAPGKPDPRAGQKLDNALSDYQTRRYTVDSQTFQLDKSGMRHILERHSAEYWDGSIKEAQTFFRPGTNIGQIQDVVGDILSQNRDLIIANPNQYEWKLSGTSEGIRYKMSIYQGRVNQLVPLR